MARKCTGGGQSNYKPQLMQAAKRARRTVEETTWVFYMVRLIDVADKMDINGGITASGVMDLFEEVDDIYELFGLDHEEDQPEPYIGVGVQKRELDTHVDVYVLVGLRVSIGTNVAVNERLQNQWDYWFCVHPSDDDEPEQTLGLDEDTVHIVQEDTVQVAWLHKIVQDMEDATHQRSVLDVFHGV